jgi:hypothetical protein
LKQIAKDVIDAVKNTLSADTHKGLVGAGETRVLSAGQYYAGTRVVHDNISSLENGIKKTAVYLVVKNIYHMRKSIFYDFSKITIEKISGKIKAISEVSPTGRLRAVVICV